MKKNASNSFMYEKFGTIGPKVEFTREELIERAKKAIEKNTLKGLNTKECVEYLNKKK